MLRLGGSSLTLIVAMGVVGLTANVAGAEDSQHFYIGDLGQAIATILIFLILLAVLGRWAWKPVVRQLKRREEDMAQALESTRRQQQEANDLLNHYRDRLQRAETEAGNLLAESRKEAAEARENILAAAREEAQRTGERVRRDIDEAKQQAISEIQGQTAELAVEIAGQIIRRQFTPEDHQRLVRESLAEVGKQIRQK